MQYVDRFHEILDKHAGMYALEPIAFNIYIYISIERIYVYAHRYTFHNRYLAFNTRRGALERVSSDLQGHFFETRPGNKLDRFLVRIFFFFYDVELTSLS